MHSNSNKTEFMIYENADEVVEELFESLLDIYQIGLETSTIGSAFILNLNCGGSYYIDWIKNGTINSISDHHKYSQYAATASLTRYYIRNKLEIICKEYQKWSIL